MESVKSVDSVKSAASRLAAARAALKGVESRMGAAREAGDVPRLPLAPALAPLLPRGLRRGQVIAVEGSTSLLLALASEASRDGSWMAIVGMPQVGVLSAARRGIDLAKLALIPYPGTQAPAALGACVDGMDVVIVGERLALSDADQRRLAALARERGSVILASGSWRSAHVTLTVERSRWSGLGAGEGRLREREVTVAVSGKAEGAPRRVLVALDVDPHAVRPRSGVRSEATGDRALGTEVA